MKVLFTLLVSLFTVITPVITRAQTASFTISADTVCQDSCITLINTSTGTIDSIRWFTYEDAIANPHSDTITICFSVAGHDSVKLYVYDSGRVDSSTQILNIKPKPHPMVSDSFPCGLRVPDIYLSYVWYFRGGGTSDDSSYYIANPGDLTFNFVVVDSNGCLGISDSVIGPCGDGVKNINNQNCEVNIFPNPATDELTIKTSYTSSYTISLFNIMGQTLKIIQTTNQQETINVSNVPAGVYNISISDEDGNRINNKVVIEH